MHQPRTFHFAFILFAAIHWLVQVPNDLNQNQTSLPTCMQEPDNQEQTCKIFGRCLAPGCDSIVLLRPNQDPRHDEIIRIPVVDGKFKHEMKLENPEGFMIALGEAVDAGAYRTMVIFLAPGEFDLTVHDQNYFGDNTISGDESMNEEYADFVAVSQEMWASLKPLYAEKDELFRTQQLYSPEMYSLYEQQKQAKTFAERTASQKQIEKLQKDGSSLSPRAKAIEKELSVKQEEINQWRLNYPNKSTSIVSFYLYYSELLDLLQSDRVSKPDVDKLRKMGEALFQNNPDHPYVAACRKVLASLEAGYVGTRYVDFSAPDLTGKRIQISDQIDGKIAMIDLWATWCGPCIAKSREYAPIYEEYQERGFTIVGVAGEYDDLEQLEAFLTKEKWPWLQLVDLDRENDVWAKYGLGSQGGAKFLVDRDGTIIAIDPTAEQLRELLDDRLGNLTQEESDR